jgi:endonuclease YncB( thermonuclease family)
MMSYFTRFLHLVAALMMVNFAVADTLYGRVVGVTDGDTVTILDTSNNKIKIRLMGIDAPERSQAFGARSKKSLSELVFNKQVTIEYFKQDKYGRTIGKILENGRDINLEQIKVGMAWHYKRYQKEQSVDDRSFYAEAEELARTKRIGLWLDSNPMPPWDWRKQAKSRK